MIKYNGNEYSISGVKSIKYNGNEYAIQEATSETWIINESPNLTPTFYISPISIVFNYYDGVSIKQATTTLISVDTITLSIYDDINTIENDYIPSESGWSSTVDDGNEYSWDNLTTEQKTTLRTITFSTSPTGNLLTWLQANAVKQ